MNFLKKLHAQRLFWKPNSINALCWAFFYVNDNKEVDLITCQIMHCIICYNSPILNLNPKIQAKKGLNVLKKHEGKRSYNMFFLCWTLSLRPFVLCLQLLVMSKARAFLNNMTKKNCFLSAILNCILRFNLKRALLIERLKRVAFWISLK